MLHMPGIYIPPLLLHIVTYFKTSLISIFTVISKLYSSTDTDIHFP